MSLLDIRNLRTHYLTRLGAVKAVDDVSISVNKGEVLGLAGESGCGKSTIALSVMRILPYPGKVISGEIMFKDRDILKLNDSELRKVRWKGISTVFQGAMASLNPLFKVGKQIADPIMIHEDVTKEEAYRRAREMLEHVGIDASRESNYPWELSGGMRQRVLIAMGLVCNPDMIIADEPTTALDVIVAHQITELIQNLREKLDLSMMLITHDISVIAQTCDQLAIMYAGKIVERSDVTTMFENPLHPYTEALIGAFPSIKGDRRQLSSIPGTPPDLIKPPSGCKFHPRCQYAQDVCKTDEPKLSKSGEKHETACHLWREILDTR
jgi:peptide/nickel transport system ATP-binding protein